MSEKNYWQQIGEDLRAKLPENPSFSDFFTNASLIFKKFADKVEKEETENLTTINDTNDLISHIMSLFTLVPYDTKLENTTILFEVFEDVLNKSSRNPRISDKLRILQNVFMGASDKIEQGEIKQKNLASQSEFVGLSRYILTIFADLIEHPLKIYDMIPNDNLVLVTKSASQKIQKNPIDASEANLYS